MCSLTPNSYIHVSMSDLYIPRIGLPVLRQPNREYINFLKYMNVEIGRQNITILS
jgi:hypothetical protein